MKWTFTYRKDPHEAEWQKGAMRCTMPEVIGRVDEIIYAGGFVPCGSAVNLVEPTLETEAGGFAVITLAIQEFADFMSLKMPLSDATVITDVIIDDDFEKAKSFNGNRSEAARYAARIRWGNRDETFDANTVPVRSTEATNGIVNGLFPEKSSEYFQDEDLTIIRGYQISGSFLNRSLRMGASEELLPAAAKLDQAFTRPEQRLDKDIVLHRGLGIHKGTPIDEAIQTNTFFDGLKVGESFKDSGFLSTSTDVNVANNFGKVTGITMEVVVRKGTPILPLPHILRGRALRGAFEEESEVLLPRNGTFKVVGITSAENGNKVIRVLADFPTLESTTKLENE